MIDVKKIESLGVSSSKLEFTEFLIESKGSKTFPDYKKLDLMKVPRLVPHVWVFNFKNGIDDGLLYHFSGTKLDENYGQNVTGKKMEDVYPGIFKDEILDCFRQVYLQKKIAYTFRSDEISEFGYIKYRIVESLLFPCSEDDQIVNFAIGIFSFTIGNEKIEPTFLIL